MFTTGILQNRLGKFDGQSNVDRRSSAGAFSRMCGGLAPNLELLVRQLLKEAGQFCVGRAPGFDWPG